AGGAQVVGLRGGTRLVLTQGPPLISATRVDTIGLTGLVLDGGNRPLPDGRGLVTFAGVRSLRITDCEFFAAGRHGIVLEGVQGEVTGSTIADAAGTAHFSRDAGGRLSGRHGSPPARRNGVQVWGPAAGAGRTTHLRDAHPG